MFEKTRLVDENRFTIGVCFTWKTKRKNEFSVDDKRPTNISLYVPKSREITPSAENNVSVALF